MPKILIIDDDRAICRTLELHYAKSGHQIITARNLSEGRVACKSFLPDVLILDLKLPDGDGIELLKELSEQKASPIVIMLTGHQDLEFAITAMKTGAFDYLLKPPDIDQLDSIVEKSLELLQNSESTKLKSNRPIGSRIVGSSQSVIELHKQIGLASATRATVLIQGESGTGKELVARAIHQFSSQNSPFVAVNCGAIPSSLIESELFGHRKGAFTGAVEDRKGLIEEAGDGTLFLDEIGEIALDVQAKLLRVLQEKSFSRIGGGRATGVKCRIIAATNRDLSQAVNDQAFRKDLYFRISPVIINVPPLRERLEDLPELVGQMIERFGSEIGKRVSAISDRDMNRLKGYGWPGNVRELENVILKSLLGSRGELLQLDFREHSEAGSEKDPPLLQTLAEIEKQHIATVLDAVNWNFGDACRILAISRPTLRKKINDYKLTRT